MVCALVSGGRGCVEETGKVVGLHREQIGDIVLEADLAPGEFRALTEEEVAGI